MPSYDGSLNSDTPVTLVRGPVNGPPLTDIFVEIFNADTAAVTLRVFYRHGTAERDIFNASLRVKAPFVLDAVDDRYPLADPDQAICAVLSAAPATTEPTWFASWKVGGL